MKIMLCVFILCLLSIVLLGQTPEWQWVNSAGGALDDLVNSCTTDDLGNVYIAGSFRGMATFGQFTLSSSGGTDAFFAKMDANGNYLNAFKLGGSDNDSGVEYLTDSQGCTYISGRFRGSMYINSTTTLVSQGSDDVFIVKINPNGYLLWATRAGGANEDACSSMYIDNSRNVYVTGNFLGIASFGSYSVTSSGGSDVFVAKLDTNGNWQWAIKAGGTGNYDTGCDICIDATGSIYLIGAFYGYASFGSFGLNSNGNGEIFIAKLNSNGTFLWVRQAGGSGSDFGAQLTRDQYSNIFITGMFRDTAAFGSTSLTSSGNEDIFVSKMDTNGNFIWAVKAGGSSMDYGYGISTDNGGGCYVTGMFTGMASFGSNSIYSSGYTDLFVSKLDASGSCLWVIKAGGSNYDKANSVAYSSNGINYIAGLYMGAASYGSLSITSSGGYDIFIAKISEPTSIATTAEYIFETSMGTFTPITGGTLLGTEASDDQRYVDPAVPQGGTTNTGPGYPIGFSFTFNENSFDRLAINNDGWISLGHSSLSPSVNTSSTSRYTPLSSIVAITPEVLYNRIAGLASDIQAQSGASLRLETIGTAPNRICVIQWLNYKKYGSNGTGDSFSFQIRLYETTNRVEIVYGTFTPNANLGNFQVGLRGPAPTDFASRTTTTNWTATTASVNNTDYCRMTNSVYPHNGLTFSFIHPTANQPPHYADLVSPANGATNVSPTSVLNWRSGGGCPTGFRLSLGTDYPPSNIVNNANMGAQTTYDPVGSLAFSTTYYWQVIPYNSNGEATNCPVWSFSTHGYGVTVGEGGSTARMPIDMYYKNSLFETVYLSSELNISGLLTGIMLYSNFVTNLPNMPTKIWVGETTQTDLAAGWIPSTQLTQVFNGNVNYPSGANNILIQLTTPYPYGGGNLVVMVHRPMDTVYYSSADVFVTQTGTVTARTRNVYSDTTVYDPANPPTATPTAIFPRTTFMFTPGVGDTPTRIIDNSFIDTSCKLGIPILLEAKLQYQGFLGLWYDLNDEPLVFQIYVNNVWVDIPDDGVSTTSLITGEGDNASGYARVYYSPPAPLLPGQYQVRAVYLGDATYTNCLLQRTLTVVKPQWLTMVYICGDNNLESNACEDFFSEMWAARDNLDVSIVALIDRIPGYYGGMDDWTETREYYVCADVNYGSPWGEQNMGDPATLYGFVQNTLIRCPADNVALILWNHGTGVCRDSSETGSRSICFDDTDHDELTIPELRNVLGYFASGTFQVLGFDACLMGMAEIAYEMKPFCDFIVVSEDIESGDGWEYQNFLTTQHLSSTTSPAQYCNEIISGTNQDTLGAWRLDNGYIDVLKSAVSSMGADLITCLQNDRTSTISFMVEALAATEGFSAYSNWPRTYIDLQGFASYINQNAGYAPLVTHSGQILSILGNSQFRTSWRNNYNDTVGGLSIYFPAGTDYGWNDYFNPDFLSFNQENNWDDLLVGYYDNIAPSLTITSPSGYGWHKELVPATTVPYEVYYIASGILHVEFQYSLDGSSWYVLPGPDSDDGIDRNGDDGWSLSFDTVNTPMHGTINDASVWVRARAKDNAGNTGAWQVTSSSFGVDNALPSISLSSVSPPPIETQVSNISLTCTDNLSGIAAGYPRFFYSYGNQTVDEGSDSIMLTSREGIWTKNNLGAMSSRPDIENGRTVYAGNIQIAPDMEGTTLYWKYKIQDNVGNVYWSDRYNATIGDNDTEGPLITELSGPYDMYPGTYSFYANFYDYSGIDWEGNPPRLYYRCNSQVIDQSHNDGYVYFNSQQCATLSISGSHLGDHLYWRVYAKDADISPASSWSPVQDAGTIQNDEPELSISTPDYTVVSSPDFYIEGTAQDSWNGINVVQLKVNNGFWNTVWSGTAASVNWGAYVSLTSGINTVYARARDTEDLYSGTESIYVQYNLGELEPPTGIVFAYVNPGYRLQWNAVPYATYYAVYSSPEPYADLQTWSLEQSHIQQTYWVDINGGNERKFYYIKAYID